MIQENNGTTPRVSVIVPCYNASRFVRYAVESILNQTEDDFELLLIDDSSSDNTAQILSELREIDQRIEVYYNKINRGVSYCRNLGIEQAKGEWIAFLDADDVWYSKKLELQLELATKTSSPFVYTSYSHLDENGKEYEFTYSIPEQTTFKRLSKWSHISTSGVLLRKSFLSSDRFERNDLREDYYLWLRLLKRTPMAVGINEPLHAVRHVKNSRSANKKHMFIQTYKVHRLMKQSALTSVVNTVCHFGRAFFLKYRYFSKDNKES